MNKKQIEAIAKVCHNANRAYCQSIGDQSQQEYEFATEDQRESAFNGVLHYLMSKNPMPEDSHKSWLAHKEAQGWKHGEVKDEFNKTHPCMVPYDQLPEAQKRKDYLFLSICDALAREMDT